ncbi:hypothetical protein HN419_00530 [Candidatus Woesearchaeota archaeon]|jgi:hypothetical protein|nr:hypothetical protein [Candidatus Woesearchaeota archaeon]MBT3537517.1 hypothetical protein [Candidatus Woesearchaeota archaeon]MBT4696821.1 hypothetical protein [Candidatus Woesearchaeota archaeon]MBT4717642.1 hypothetical protein [Candidatus Woesearchaeota archaeon]MBT7106173.1 hypothetical protein [Candidatus Woesearchaeota archaeon]
MEDNQPIFVKIDEYKDVLDVISLIKKKIGDAKVVLGELDDLRAQESTEVESWKEKVAEIETRVNSIDATLFKP